MINNYSIDDEDLANKFEAKKTNWMNENSDQFNKVLPTFDDVYTLVIEELNNENKRGLKNIPVTGKSASLSSGA